MLTLQPPCSTTITSINNLLQHNFTNIDYVTVTLHVLAKDNLTPSLYNETPTLQAAATMMFVSQMMFNARVSDVKMGGTYMTLLNTMINLSGNSYC